MIFIRRIGNWRGVTRLVNRMDVYAYRAQRLSLKRWGLKAERLAKKHISRQDLRWAPLNPAYKAYKKKAEYSPKTYVMTASYFQSITSFVRGDTVYAGLRKGAKNKAGRPLGSIAHRLEYGDRKTNLPARPLWHPTMEETKEWHRVHNTPELLMYRMLNRIKP